MEKLLIKAIDLYRGTLSLFVGGQCRFYPTCSYYAQKAIERKGVFKGIGLSFLRLLKCHPFHPGGIDDVE